MSLILDRVVPARRVPRPPGPSGASLLRAFTSRQPEASGDWFVRTARDHPRICYLYGGPRRHTYVVNHPDLVSEVLRTKGRVMRKGPPFQVMKELFGEQRRACLEIGIARRLRSVRVGIDEAKDVD